jgi:hypothetical protein
MPLGSPGSSFARGEVLLTPGELKNGHFTGHQQLTASAPLKQSDTRLEAQRELLFYFVGSDPRRSALICG